jgi:hypothetical protein
MFNDKKEAASTASTAANLNIYHGDDSSLLAIESRTIDKEVYHAN